MKRLLILGVIVLAPNAADAKPPAFQCPGENTVQMHYCAEKSWEQSDAQLRQKVGKQLMEHWQVWGWSCGGDEGSARELCGVCMN